MSGIGFLEGLPAPYKIPADGQAYYDGWAEAAEYVAVRMRELADDHKAGKFLLAGPGWIVDYPGHEQHGRSVPEDTLIRTDSKGRVWGFTIRQKGHGASWLGPEVDEFLVRRAHVTPVGE